MQYYSATKIHTLIKYAETWTISNMLWSRESRQKDYILYNSVLYEMFRRDIIIDVDSKTVFLRPESDSRDRLKMGMWELLGYRNV